MGDDGSGGDVQQREPVLELFLYVNLIITSSLSRLRWKVKKNLLIILNMFKCESTHTHTKKKKNRQLKYTEIVSDLKVKKTESS